MQFDTFPFAIILTENKKAITVSNAPTSFVHFEKSDGSNQTLSIQERLIIQLLCQISHPYNKLIKKTNTLEGELQISTENSQLYQLMATQKSLVYFQYALTSNLDACHTLYDKEHADKKNLLISLHYKIY